ncbi:MAG: lipoyl synthase, partial [Lentisphaeria bacterium]|nr:lipoyl synthase [Lentisphaeria bacterium]
MNDDHSFRPKLPPWIRVKVPCGAQREHVDSLLKMNALNTVCRGAQCPNLCECWHRGTAAFMILGDRCTRNCKFCAVGHVEAPLPPDPAEPENLANAAASMKLSFVVVTSVTRDDLPDGGSAHFAATIRALKAKIPGVRVEVLVPDFNFVKKDMQTVLDACPDIYNHNVETVERLTPLIRSKAQYRRSLDVLRTAYQMTGGKIPVKSGIMVGMGETDEEVLQTIRDIRDTGAEFLTVGQYLPPSKDHWKLERYVEPATFEAWGKY